MYPPGGFLAFWLFRPKGFIPTKSNITPRLPNGGAYGSYAVPASYHHGRLRVEEIFFKAPTDGSADRGDPVGKRLIFWLVGETKVLE